MDTALELLIELARRFAFGDVGVLAPLVAGAEARRVTTVCEFGQRLLSLDAEDFATGADAVPAELRRQARACHMPQTPRERPRGALASLRPAYGLLLEVIGVRWRRGELGPAMAALHIAAEYLPLLAFEPVLGHAGDPARWPAGLRAEGSRFGVPAASSYGRADARAGAPAGPQPVSPTCAHNRAERSAAERTLRVASEPGPGWRAYLDRQHSVVADALSTCVSRCRHPCTAMDWVEPAPRADLALRCTVARAFADSPLVRLRHAAPVGHGFGVPSTDEVLEAWERSRARLDKDEVGHQATVDDGFALPGLPSLFSAIAAAPIEPASLLAGTAEHLVGLLARLPAGPLADPPAGLETGAG